MFWSAQDQRSAVRRLINVLMPVRAFVVLVAVTGKKLHTSLISLNAREGICCFGQGCDSGKISKQDKVLMPVRAFVVLV